MRRFTTVPGYFLCSALVVAAVAGAAPRWTRSVGLDFWNVRTDEDRLRKATDERCEWDFQRERVLERCAVSEHIATGLCEDRITFAEALKSITALAQASPDWFAQLRYSYRSQGWVPPRATERDVMIRYLITRVESILSSAEQLGDSSRAAFLATRLARLTEEAQIHPPAPQRCGADR
jgi:hypothetical protein